MNVSYQKLEQFLLEQYNESQKMMNEAENDSSMRYWEVTRNSFGRVLFELKNGKFN